ncbi:putative methyltransferase PMT28 [Capsicum annuum]|uniref:Methyltransferase PMT28 n=3 Tax=Capsicum annuum TaxID=4072 RepID=A0A1U8GIK8_CAPAN|nr:putative methyltransferase PMT28 [Capsicum annuum]
MRKHNTALTRFGRKVKGSYQSYGLGVKLAAVVILGLCFVFIWSVFSPPSYSVAYQRDTFDDIREPISSANKKKVTSLVPSTKKEQPHNKKLRHRSSSVEKKKSVDRSKSGSWHKNEKSGGVRKRKGEDLKLPKKVDEIKNQDLVGSEENEEEKMENDKQQEEKKVVENDSKQEEGGVDGKENEKEKTENGEEGVEGKENEKEETESDKEEGGEGTVDGNEGNGELANTDDLKVEDEDEKSRVDGKKKKNLGPLFDPNAHYTWNLCSTRSKHNYIPCIDFESASGKLQNYRHHERSCPRAPQMCLVPLPPDGYETPVSWPESKSKILYKNVAHPKLEAFVKKGSWIMESGEYLTFPTNQSIPKGGIQHYLDFIEEMAPDIEWGKNIRVVLDIGCKDSSFGASLLEKDVLALTLGLKDDLVDLAQVALERGFPAVVTPFGTRRFSFPSGVFDAIHCSDCRASWHSNGGKHLIEMNRILRPGGYFILSSKHNTIEVEEAMSTLTASICWNILADKTDEISDIRIKLFQKPQANDMYQMRRKKVPPLCKENENPDASWYVPIKSCLYTIPESIEQRGTEWPEEWPKRLETFPDWMNNREKLIADSEHWKAIVDNSYLVGLGIDWSKIRNVMDMKAINGGFAAALAQKKVWVMNVIPVHAPNTLPVIFERGLIGMYHDWCEAFGTYPRSYDLLHADHLFSRLKNRCKHPIVIVVEMDRILRPGGWGIIRDKVEILDPLGKILRSLHWEIRMTFTKDKEGILCAQKTMWRP